MIIMGSKGFPNHNYIDNDDDDIRMVVEQMCNTYSTEVDNVARDG